MLMILSCVVIALSCAGAGPVFRLYPGMAASSSSSFRQDFAVSVDFQFCTYTPNSILPPTCALPCTATQTSNGCNVPATSTSTCQGIGCSSNHVPIPSCSNNMCVGTCDPAYQDCNNDKAVDGCETRIADDVCTRTYSLSLSLIRSFIRSLPLVCVDWMRETSELLMNDVVLTRGWFGLVWIGLDWTRSSTRQLWRMWSDMPTDWQWSIMCQWSVPAPMCGRHCRLQPRHHRWM